MELIRPGTRIDFMRQRRFWIILSTILALGSLILVFVPPGPNYGTDFRGGTELEVRFRKAIEAGEVRRAVESIPGFSRPDVVAVGQSGENRFLIRVQEHRAVGEEQQRQLRLALCLANGGYADAKGKWVPDPPLDPNHCPESDLARRPTEVKFSPGGDKLAVRYETRPDDELLKRLREALTAAHITMRGAVDDNAKSFPVTVVGEAALDENLRQKVRAALCFQGSRVDEKGAFVTDPPLDAAHCPTSAHKPIDVRFSTAGDKLTVRYAVKVDDEIIRQARQAIAVTGAIALGPPVDETADVAIKGHDLAQAKEFRVEVQLQSKGDELLRELRQRLGPDTVPASADKVEWVGPRAGKQLRDAAVKSVMFAIIFMMAYVAFRFDLRFAPGGILALIHDALVVIGVFIVTRREITLSTIAAILTIVGYSMSDTVIIYDRIRENLNKHRGMTFHEIINLSVSETLSRTILTSGSVLLSVVGMFFSGTGALKDFALALFVGVIAGTYSSIFVAAPLTEWIDRKWFGASATQRKSAGRKRPGTGPGGARHQAQHQV